MFDFLGKIEWTQIIIAFLTVGLPAMIMSWRNGRKIDDNTSKTETASTAAVSAESKVDTMLNGGMTKKIEAVVQAALVPVREAMQVHDKKDDANITSVMKAIEDLKTATEQPKSD